MTSEEKKPINCDICGNPIPVCPISGWRYGNNAQPVNDGRCCDVCNTTVVIPRRLTDLARLS